VQYERIAGLPVVKSGGFVFRITAQKNARTLQYGHLKNQPKKIKLNHSTNDTLLYVSGLGFV